MRRVTLYRDTTHMTDRDPESQLPLTPAMFHVMVAIADEDRHGYAIIKDVAARSEGAVALSTGTLYGIVKRLLADGLAAESRQRPPASRDDERRRYYRLTESGRAVARAEAARMESVLAAARATHLLRKPRRA
jgi:DNA-binding PadR family transcriptional regulator